MQSQVLFAAPDENGLWQAAQSSRGQQRAGEEVRRLVRCPVAGKHDPAAFVALVDAITQVFGGRRMQRFEARVVEDWQIRPQMHDGHDGPPKRLLDST